MDVEEVRVTKAQKLKQELEEARSSFNKAWVDEKRFDEELFATVRRLEKEHGDAFLAEARQIDQTIGTGAGAAMRCWHRCRP